MMQTMTRGNESSAPTGDLLVAFELSQRCWKVGFTTGMGHRVRTRRIAAGALESVAEAIEHMRRYQERRTPCNAFATDEGTGHQQGPLTATAVDETPNNDAVRHEPPIM